MYVDRDSIFRAEDGHPEDPRPTLTQFSRALQELQIGLILAYSPQAKGRIERFFQTAQDRLVKELRLAGAATMEQANEVLAKIFLPWFNRCCSVKAVSGNDAHRPLHGSMSLASILSIQEKRRVCSDYTIRLDNQIYQLLGPAAPGLRGGRVIIEKRLDGTLLLRLKKTYLAYQRLGPAPKKRTALLEKTNGKAAPSRSLSLGKTPAGKDSDASDRKQARTASAAGPSAVRLTSGRSGRTPAEPYPPKGVGSVPAHATLRPRPGQAWMRNFRLPGSRPKADILIGAD